MAICNWFSDPDRLRSFAYDLGGGAERAAKGVG
jgi:hypothetical protein